MLATVGDDDVTVVLHRKVYLSEKETKDEGPIIHPISLTIPVRMKDDLNSNLPKPRPLYKMRKYTYTDPNPEIEMVPITTTVLKPVGVSKDQIIGSDMLI